MVTNVQKTILPAEIMFIPDYIVNALNSRGVTLADLNSAIALDLHDDMRIQGGDKDIQEMNNGFNPNNTGRQLLQSKLSRIDREDLHIWNRYDILRLSCGEYEYGTYAAYIAENIGYLFKPDQERITKTLLSLYNNTMSINNKTFSTYSGSDCLFVILHSGFSNYIINKDNDLRIKLLKDLASEMVKCFGEERFAVSTVFTLFIKLLKN